MKVFKLNQSDHTEQRSDLQIVLDLFKEQVKRQHELDTAILNVLRLIEQQLNALHDRLNLRG